MTGRVNRGVSEKLEMLSFLMWVVDASVHFSSNALTLQMDSFTLLSLKKFF